MATARELYESTVCHLPVMDRLRLACFILNGIAMPSSSEAGMSQDGIDPDASALAAFLMEHSGAGIQLDERKP